MANPRPVTMLVTYHPQAGKEERMQELVEAHWAALDRLGLVTSEPVKIWRATDKKTGAVSFVETFQWKDEESSRLAHELPEIMAIWEPMVTVLEELTLQVLEPLTTKEAGVRA